MVRVSPGDRAVGLGQHDGGLQVAAALDEGVEEPGAVVAVVAGVVAVVATSGDLTRVWVAEGSGTGMGGRCGCGERDQALP